MPKPAEAVRSAPMLRAMTERAARHPNRAAALILAAFAYIPILLTQPGRVSADTKTYLTLDPSAVLRQATSMWDPSVGAGTVPHQNIGYLFPLGPYYWVMEAIGSPDWITQRLMWGTLVFAAAFGMFRLARWLGWSSVGALVAAFAYGFTPYLLSYLARLSVILGPWSALPWMILLVSKAARTRSWKPAAQFAVVVALVGSVNATALVLAGLGPVIWLIADVVSGRVRPGAATRAAIKIGVLSAAVSLWWAVALRIQGTYGLPILRYTETYESVAGSSTPTEIMRGLGYWFFYGGDRLDPWVGPAAPYFDRSAVMALGFTIAGVGLLGFLTRFSGRVAAATLLVLGLAVSVGAAPLGNSTPYGAIFKWFASDTTAGFALRSTPRAAPLVILALAFGFGASTEWLRGVLADRAPSTAIGRRRGLLVSMGAIGLIVLQLFPWFTLHSMSPSIERDEALPSYETDLAAWLDANRSPDGAGRVWEIPASDFANYRYGGTVDPVLPGIIERSYLARELVPQGGAGTADLLNAFERRLPEGWFEPATLPVIAKRFGVDTIVVRNDLEHERYLLARPGPLWRDLQTALGAPDYAGPMVEDNTVIPLLDERTLASDDIPSTFPVVAAWNLDPSPIAGTASATSPIVLAGSGDGLVDLAGAGLLDPNRAVLYASTLHDLVAAGTFDPAMVGADTWWVISDTNRKQARHWSTVSSNLGALEGGTPVSLDADPNDQQLDVFVPNDPTAVDRQTIAVHRGDVTDVRASYYGNRIAFTAGDAPAFAIDGDPTTAWRAGAFGPTGGIRWEADLAEPVTTSTITLLQPVTDATNRYITSVQITLDAGLPTETVFDVALDDSSQAEPGQAIDLPVDSFRTIRIEIVDDNIGKSADYTTLPGVGFAEVSIPGVTDDLLARVPSLDAFDVVDPAAIADQRTTYLFTRQRIAQSTPNESPPEESLAREFAVVDGRPFALTGDARLSSWASEETLGSVFGDQYPVVADRRLRGSPGSRGAAAFDGDLTTAWQTGFRLVDGATVTVDHPSPISTDHMTLSWRDDGRHSIPTEVTITSDDGTVRVVGVPTTTPVDGVATATLPLGDYRASQSTITFSGVEARTTPNYFSRLQEQLPLGIAEIELGDQPAERVDPSAALDDSCRSDLITVDDVAVPVRILGTRGDAATRDKLSIEACGPALDLSVGTHRLRATAGAVTGFDVDRVVLDGAGAATPPTAGSPPGTTVDSVTDTKIRLTVDAAAASSWLVLQQSWNAGWHATSDGADLGTPVLINGYANGWLLPASATSRAITLEWTPQHTMNLALMLSLVAGLAVIGILVRTRRTLLPASIDDIGDDTSWSGVRQDSPIVAVVLVGLFAFVAGPLVALGAAIVLLTRRRAPWLPIAVVVGLGGIVAGLVIVSQWHFHYPPGPDWPSRFGWTSSLVWMAVAAVAVAAIMPTGARRRQ
jgi:arabinofuranan 3-O-arabinosyltransferase